MIDFSIQPSAHGLWQPYGVYPLRLFFAEEAVEFMIDIAVQLLLPPLLFCTVLLPAGIILPIAAIAHGLLPYPLCVLRLVLSQLLAVSLICGQHGIHPHGNPNLVLIVLMPADGYTDGNIYL